MTATRITEQPLSVSTQRANPVYRLALVFVAALAALPALPQLAGETIIVTTIATTAAGLALWLAALWLRERRDGQALKVSIVAVKSHYVQACCQGALYLYWGWFWQPVYDHMPLILGQVLLVYCLDMLVSLTRRRKWTLGFGPFPIILSTNLFLLFKPDWFYLQFAMLALGVLGKEFLRWNRDGKNTHIFNPSAFPLFVFSIGLLATGTTDLTWAEAIATELNRPPHIYLYIFVLGLIVQALFSVTLVTLWAALALIGLNTVYTQVTGVYYFFDSNIPIAVFLGLHLLVTDPATSPSTNVGKVMFGAGYGIAVFLLYGLLESWGLPRFYDKLLCVPLLNLMVPLFDGITRRMSGRLPWASRIETRNATHMAIWIIVFSGMLASHFVGKGHDGANTAFWESACENGRRNGCDNLLKLHTDNCADGSASACLEASHLLGRAVTVPNDPSQRGSMLARACDLGSRTGCNQFSSFVADGGGELFQRSCTAGDGLSCFLLGTIEMYGIERKTAPKAGLVHWERACELGFARACGDLGEAWLFGAASVEPAEIVSKLGIACDSEYWSSCANLGLFYMRGRGVPANEALGRALLEESCDAGLEVACSILKE